MIAPYLANELRENGMVESAAFVQEWFAEFPDSRVRCTEGRKRWRYPVETAQEIADRNVKGK